MNGPFLIIETDPPLRLLSVGDTAPGLYWAAIIGTSAIRRPGDGSETANVSLDLDNADGAISRILAVPPLRAGAVLHAPTGEEWFRGVLSGVTLAETAQLTLEA